MEATDKIKSALSIGPKVKVIGQVDLGSINEATRPVKKTKEERAEERQKKTEEMQTYNRELIIRDLEKKRDALQQEIREMSEKANDLRRHINDARNNAGEERKEKELRLKYLQEKRAVRERYADLTLTNDQRQKDLALYGIRPKKMDVVHFHVPKTKEAEEMEGVALVRDENHYYLAIDLYDQPDQEDNATTLMDINADGTFEGIWPKYTVLKPASSIEERFIRAITDKYADDLANADEITENLQKQEARDMEQLAKDIADMRVDVSDDEHTLDEMENKLRQLNADLLNVGMELRKYKSDAAAGAGTDILDFSFGNDAEYEPMEGLGLDSPAEQKYIHLPYVRGNRQMLTMNWPVIEPTYEAWLRFRLMSNIARVLMLLRKSHALTYVLTDDYYEEMSKRGREYYKGMKIDDVVPHGESASGVIVYPSQGYQDTILYRVDNRNQLSILVVYLREDRLMFYESYSMQEVINRPRTDNFMCRSMKDSGTDPSRLFSWIRNLVISHLAMEQDMERTIRHLVEEDKGSAIEKDIRENDAVDTTDDHDIVLRDAAWYTDITVNREIPVRGYLSHRWCGTGKDKFIKEVWVRPHVKHGYHRDAGVKKSEA